MRACVIGAGLGGLALAIRLQAEGVETTLIEARERPGGLVHAWRRDGFAFEAGPTAIAGPALLRELWQLAGEDMADDVTLLPVKPFFRLLWPDGTRFDYSNNDADMRRQIARIEPSDIAGYDELLAYARDIYDDGYERFAATAFLDKVSAFQAAPMLGKYQAWRSVYALVSSFIREERLRQALSFFTLPMGGNPLTTSAIYTLAHHMIHEDGFWWVKGGTSELALAMARLFERMGGTLRLADPVVKIDTLGDKVTGVTTASGWHSHFESIASNADLVHTYRQLLGHNNHARRTARRIAGKRFSPSVFVVHFGLEGSFPGIAHHSVLFGLRYEDLLRDIYDYGVLPDDMMVYLHHPSASDPAMAPPGQSAFYALIPVAHLGKLPIDWTAFAPVLAQRVLDEVSQRLIPDLQSRIITRFWYTPRDFAMDFNACHGSAFSLEPIIRQSGWLRPHNKDDMLRNFYLVGAGVHPGAGVAPVIAGARATARLMLRDGNT